MNIWERLNVFIKILSSFIVPLVLTNIFVVLLKRLTKHQLYQNSDIFTFIITTVIAFIWVLATFENYLYSSKSIIIADRLLAKENIKLTMKEMKWKAIEIDENVFTFKNPFFREFKNLKLSIRFIDTEAIIEGPEHYVDKVIEEYKTLIAI
ncbi:hypothetical protein [Clostridium sp.]|uniref:hypothetical protein n=1 Tax=Clostridium sp. TaxID=1506 RepID=UPI003D6C7162